MKPTVFVPEHIDRSGLDLLREQCECLIPWEKGSQEVDTDELRAMLYEVDAVIVRLFKIGEEDLERTNRLKVIAKHGVGVDSIDCQAASDKGIPVVYTPAANANAVAEHTLTLILSLARGIVPAHAAVREGRFHQRNQLQGVELAGSVLGVIGLGRIGARVAQIASVGFEMVVHAFDPFVQKEDYSGPAILEDSLEPLLRKADFLTIHVPSTPDTKHLINEQSLDMAKSDCIIVNASRGAVINEKALVQALKEDKIAGAALDVFEEEPLPADHPLCHLPNVLLTPHIAGITGKSMERMSLHAAQGILDVLNGRTPQYIVNPEVLE